MAVPVSPNETLLPNRERERERFEVYYKIFSFLIFFFDPSSFSSSLEILLHFLRFDVRICFKRICFVFLMSKYENSYDMIYDRRLPLDSNWWTTSYPAIHSVENKRKKNNYKFQSRIKSIIYLFQSKLDEKNLEDHSPKLDRKISDPLNPNRIRFGPYSDKHSYHRMSNYESKDLQSVEFGIYSFQILRFWLVPYDRLETKEWSVSDGQQRDNAKNHLDLSVPR